MTEGYGHREIDIDRRSTNYNSRYVTRANEGLSLAIAQ